LFKNASKTVLIVEMGEKGRWAGVFASGQTDRSTDKKGAQQVRLTGMYLILRPNITEWPTAFLRKAVLATD
jgi:hypothetical protein